MQIIYLATLISYGFLEIFKQYDRYLKVPDLVFQRDNAPVHKSEVVCNFLAQKEGEVLDWPSYSPDLSPFEIIWTVFFEKHAMSDCYLGKFRRKVYGSVKQHKH